MFENLFFDPIANGGEFHKVEESGAQFFKASSDGAGLFDALEEVLHMMALLVKTFVILRRVAFVGLGRNACLESERLKQFPERGAAVGLVCEDRSGVLAGDQPGGSDAVVAVACSKDDAHGSPSGIDQGVDFRIRPSFGSADALDINALRPAKSVLVNLRAGGVDRPELPKGGTRERVEDLVPNTGFAPSLPSRVDGGVWREDAQRPPRAAFAHPEKHREKDQLRINWRPPTLGFTAGCGSTRVALINFFSRFALAASFGWMRMVPIQHHTRL